MASNCVSVSSRSGVERLASSRSTGREAASRGAGNTPQRAFPRFGPERSLCGHHRRKERVGLGRREQLEARHERLSAPTHRYEAVGAHPIVNDGTAAGGPAAHQASDLLGGRAAELLQQAGAQLSVAADLIEYGRWGDVYLWGVTVDELVRERREAPPSTVPRPLRQVQAQPLHPASSIMFAALSWVARRLTRPLMTSGACRPAGLLRPSAGRHRPPPTFESWDRVLPERTATVSLLDRLLRHCHVVVTDGESYRMFGAGNRGGATPPAN